MLALTYNPMKINENKGNLMGHTKKQYLKNELTQPNKPNLTQHHKNKVSGAVSRTLK